MNNSIGKNLFGAIFSLGFGFGNKHELNIITDNEFEVFYLARFLRKLSQIIINVSVYLFTILFIIFILLLIILCYCVTCAAALINKEI